MVCRVVVLPAEKWSHHCGLSTELSRGYNLLASQGERRFAREGRTQSECVLINRDGDGAGVELVEEVDIADAE